MTRSLSSGLSQRPPADRKLIAQATAASSRLLTLTTSGVNGNPASATAASGGGAAAFQLRTASVAAAREQWAELAHRTHMLEINGRYATKPLELQREWLDEA